MADYCTHSFISTKTCTWVLALVIDAGLAEGTFRVDGALRPASDIRISKVIWQAGTHSPVCYNTAVGVGAAGCWNAGVWWFPNCMGRQCDLWKGCAWYENIHSATSTVIGNHYLLFVVLCIMLLTEKLKRENLLSWQREKGSPVMVRGQLHTGLWLTTSQKAFIPQVPGHGSAHFCLMHARYCGQSELRRHSGLHSL